MDWTARTGNAVPTERGDFVDVTFEGQNHVDSVSFEIHTYKRLNSGLENLLSKIR